MGSPTAKPFVTLAIAALWNLGPCEAALAQTKITLLYNPVSDVAAAFVAKDQGYFENRKLDLDLVLSPNAGAIPGALLSNTAQIGVTTPPVLLQADEQDLDLVVIEGTDVTSLRPTQTSGFIVRDGSGIHNPSELIGRKVGVPVLGGTLDVLARHSVQVAGADYHRVKWIEIPFPQMGDALKGNFLDAVVGVFPFYDRIIDSKVGYPIGGTLVPPGTMPLQYAATRKWATQHPDLVSAFRAALVDASVFYQDQNHQDAVLSSVAKWTKLPRQAVTPGSIPAQLKVQVQPDDLVFWIQTLHEEGLIKGNLDPASLIAP